MSRRRTRADERIHVVTLVDLIRNAGGAERVAKEVALRLDPERFRSTLCITRVPSYSTDGAAARAEVEASHVRLISLERTGRIGAAGWRRFVNYLRRERADVLHTHLFGSNAWGSVLGRVAGVPALVAHEHGFSHEPARVLVERHVIGRLADEIIAVSTVDRDRMVADGLPGRRIRVLPNGVDVHPAPGHDMRAALGVAPGVPVVATACVIREVKRLDVLLDAIVRVRERLPEVVCLIAGWGPDEDAVRARATAAGLDGTVRFLGVRDDVVAVLSAADVVALSSDSEGSPLVVLEAMEAARPVVATRVGGVPDLIEAGVHGLLVPRRDPVALADGLLELLTDPARARAMGERARERCRTEFSFAAMVRRCEALYEELLAAPRRR